MDDARARSIGAATLRTWQLEVERDNELRRQVGGRESTVDYVITDVRRIGRTWCVFYDDRRYVETGDWLHALGGNGPILVSDDGRVGVAGSARSVEEEVAAFEGSPTAS